MSDIAERLKELKSEMIFRDGQGGGCVVCRPEVLTEAKNLCFSNLDTIISALQFAEDMRTLADIGYSVHVYGSSDELPNWTVGLIEDGDDASEESILNFYGPDIFAAARNAVEQMEGK